MQRRIAENTVTSLHVFWSCFKGNTICSKPCEILLVLTIISLPVTFRDESRNFFLKNSVTWGVKFYMKWVNAWHAFWRQIMCGSFFEKVPLGFLFKATSTESVNEFRESAHILSPPHLSKSTFLFNQIMDSGFEQQKWKRGSVRSFSAIGIRKQNSSGWEIVDNISIWIWNWGCFGVISYVNYWSYPNSCGGPL